MTVGTLRCALPLSCVVETMRPLPLHSLASSPGFVSGASVIRGEPLPVVNLAALLGAEAGAPGRFVVVRAGDHKVALGVDTVVGVQDVLAATMARVPPLLANARSDAVTELGTLDREVLLVLQAGHIVPDEVWPVLV